MLSVRGPYVTPDFISVLGDKLREHEWEVEKRTPSTWTSLRKRGWKR